MLAADTAGGDYCREYFREQRYTFFAARSMGHNFPIVDGVEQTGTVECAARSFNVTTESAVDTITIDLTGVLATDALTRQLRVLKGNRVTGHIVVEDTFDLTRPVEIRDRVVSFDAPEVIGKGALRFGGEDGMTMRFDEDALEAVIAPALNGKKTVYTTDLVPRVPEAGTQVITMTWDAE